MNLAESMLREICRNCDDCGLFVVVGEGAEELENDKENKRAGAFVQARLSHVGPTTRQGSLASLLGVILHQVHVFVFEGVNNCMSYSKVLVGVVRSKYSN